MPPQVTFLNRSSVVIICTVSKCEPAFTSQTSWQLTQSFLYICVCLRHGPSFRPVLTMPVSLHYSPHAFSNNGALGKWLAPSLGFLILEIRIVVPTCVAYSTISASVYLPIVVGSSHVTCIPHLPSLIVALKKHFLNVYCRFGESQMQSFLLLFAFQVQHEATLPQNYKTRDHLVCPVQYNSFIEK